MTKCANCPQEAFYTYPITATFGIHYCSRHVPKFLAGQKSVGMLPLRVTEAVVEVAPTPKKSKAKSEPVVEVVEPVEEITEVVEEVPVEEVVSEEIAPE